VIARIIQISIGSQKDISFTSRLAIDRHFRHYNVDQIAGMALAEFENLQKN
jgi:hypothetical protein